MRNRLKWLLAGMALFLSASLSGCTMVSTDVTVLMSPPKLTKEQQAIEQALTNALGGKPTLQYPLEGDYRSSFVLHSFDHGATQSALAFYTTSKEKSGTHIMVLHQVGSKWEKVCDISGDGNEVDRVEFGDFDGSGAEEMAVGWTSFTSTNMALGIYAIQDGQYEKIYRDSYTDMADVSMSNARKDELLLLKLDSSDKTASAELVGAQGGEVVRVSQTSLDSTVTSYAGLYATTMDGKPTVLIDSRKGDDKMVTEMVQWDKGRLTSPLYDQKQKMANAETLRDVTVLCQDIDGDGKLEIPVVPTEMPGYDKLDGVTPSDKIWKIQWMIWKGNALVSKLYSVINSAEGYTFLFPKKWDTAVPSVTVEREGGDSDWAFYAWNASTHSKGARLFDILAFSKDEWDSASGDTSFQHITDSTGMVYVYRAYASGQKNADMLDIATVRRNFRLVE